MLMQSPSEDIKSINIGGTEYTADDKGAIRVNDPAHIYAAQQDGWTAIHGVVASSAPAPTQEA